MNDTNFTFATSIHYIEFNVYLKRPCTKVLYLVCSVLSLGYAILTVRITEFGLPKANLFCNLQRDVASLPSYSKLNSNSSHVILI